MIISALKLENAQLLLTIHLMIVIILDKIHDLDL
jgi:hypothetical protein